MHSKTDYILRSLSKIRHKRWELFVISRIFHRLDDEEIEFVTQQLVRRPNGKIALTDIYFPQFSLHLEINEGHHKILTNEEADAVRMMDIVTVTGHQIRAIDVADNLNGQIIERPLQTIEADIEAFIDHLRFQKAERVKTETFKPWNFDHRYDPEVHIRRGYISTQDNVVFKRQDHALSCFGFSGNGYQRGVWKLKDGSNDVVWFPRLYTHGDWKNELSSDGMTIVEEALTDKGRASIQTQLSQTHGHFIVFGKAKDDLGGALYRFVGTFKMNKSRSSPDAIRFDKIRDVETIRANAN